MFKHHVSKCKSYSRHTCIFWNLNSNHFHRCRIRVFPPLPGQPEESIVSCVYTWSNRIVCLFCCSLVKLPSVFMLIPLHLLSLTVVLKQRLLVWLFDSRLLLKHLLKSKQSLLQYPERLGSRFWPVLICHLFQKQLLPSPVFLRLKLASCHYQNILISWM